MGGLQRPVAAPRLDFQVTADIIATAIPRDSAHCMIADALKAAMPRAAWVSVDLATIRFTDLVAGRRYIYLTPRSAQEALIAFDQGERPEPFRVRGSAAQMIRTGSARYARKIADPANPDPGPDDDVEPTPKPKRKSREKGQPATIGDQNGRNNVPIIEGGRQLPIGPLAKPDVKRPASKKPARRREFGLRAMIR